MRTDDYDSYFVNEDGNKELTINIKWDRPRKVSYLVIKEAIPLSQRVESFSVSYENDGIMQECYKGTTIGYKKIIDLQEMETKNLIIHIDDARVAPAISFVGVY